ncbi:MAG: TatD family hydrolase [Alphaproteobacteria bacterium]
MIKKNYFVDSHCHLDFLQNDGLDVARVLSRARDNGVERFLSISTKMETFPTILQIAEKFSGVYASVGVHPHDSDGAVGVISVDDLVIATQHEKVIAIGESGLDFFYDNSDRMNQEKSFRMHLAAARQADVPMIVHSRSADVATLDILCSESDGTKLQGLLHCFSSGRELAMGALDLGFYISLSGILTFPKAEEIRSIAKDIPLDKLLLETDSPYLAPLPYRGKKNEPAYLPETAKILADIKNISVDEIKTITTDNFFRLFKKAA